MKKYIFPPSSVSLLFFFLFLSFPLFIHAEEITELEKIIVTAHLYQQNLHDVPQSVEVITEKDLKEHKSQNIAEALESIAGVSIVSQGSPAEDLNIRIRGSDRDEVLVLLDGVPVNNVIEYRALLLNAFPTDMIERIEIIKGAQSVLYGTSASGGIINIITKKKVDEPFREIGAFAGNLGYYKETATWLQSFNKHHFALNYTRTDQYGRFSHDEFSGNHIFFNYLFEPTDKWQFQINFSFLDHNQELAFGTATSFANFPTIDIYFVREDDRQYNRDLFIPQAIIKYSPFEWYTAQFSYSLYYEDQKLTNTNQNQSTPDPTATLDSQDFTSTGHRHRFDLQNHFELLGQGSFKSHLVIGGTTTLEYLKYTDAPFLGDTTTKTTTTFPDESQGQKGNRYNLAGYILNQSSLNDRVFASLGVRFDKNSTYGMAGSPRFSLAYHHKETDSKIYTSYAQGFFAPSINQYYLALIGGTLSQRLDKEESQTYEIGWQQGIKNLATLNLTYFHTDYDTFIDELQLIQNATVQGLETSLEITPFDWMTFDGNYTWLVTENEATGNDLNSRPDHTVNLNVLIQPLKNLSLLGNAQYVSSRRIPKILSTDAMGDLSINPIDAWGNAAGERLPSYFLLNFAASYKHELPLTWLKELEYSLKLNNILNKSYQERFGFPMPRFHFIAGVEGRF